MLEILLITVAALIVLLFSVMFVLKIKNKLFPNENSGYMWTILDGRWKYDNSNKWVVPYLFNPSKRRELQDAEKEREVMRKEDALAKRIKEVTNVDIKDSAKFRAIEIVSIEGNMFKIKVYYRFAYKVRENIEDVKGVALEITLNNKGIVQYPPVTSEEIAEIKRDTQQYLDNLRNSPDSSTAGFYGTKVDDILEINYMCFNNDLYADFILRPR